MSDMVESGKISGDRLRILVPYDGDHVDLRVLMAIGEVLRRGRSDGMTDGGYRRVAAFISSCAAEYAPHSIT